MQAKTRADKPKNPQNPERGLGPALRWWNWVQNEDGSRTLYLDGPIAEESWLGDEVTPKQFKSELLSGEGDITIWINSPGGDVFAASQKVCGSVVPAAITYQKDHSGNYALEKYEQAKDGADWQPSIRKFCTMPVSGKEIPGLADTIIEHYTNYEDIRMLQRRNLFAHLRKNGIGDAVLYNSGGEMEAAMSDPQYIN